MRRLFDHIDLRVRSFSAARPFYAAFLPAVGFSEFCETPIGIAFDAVRDHPKPEFVGLIEDPDHVPNATRMAQRLGAFAGGDRSAFDDERMAAGSAGALVEPETRAD